MNDFRQRFGASLGVAAARLLRGGAPAADFRDRLGLQLTAAAAQLADERAPAADFRARLGVQLSAAAAGLAVERAPARRAPAMPRLTGPWRARPDFRDRFGLALTAAAAQLAGERAPAARRRRRIPSMPRLVGPARLHRPLAVALGLTVFAGAATASSLWLVQVGNPQYGYSPGLSATPPPAVELAALAVLRRPQSAADRGPGVQAALEDVNNFTTGVRTDYVRVLETTANGPVVLVPVVSRDAAPGRPAIADALCVYYPQGTSAEAITPACWSLAQVEAGQATATVNNQVYGLAPDGMSTIDVPAPGGGTLSAPVSGNFFDVTAAAQPGSPAAPPPNPAAG
jgi:hypothetical protein